MVSKAALFLKSRVGRQIQYNGTSYEFTKYKVDKFGQTSNEIDSTIVVSGLFHTTNAYIKSSDSDGARLVSKPEPRILMLYEDGNTIAKDDEVEINGNKYKVVEKCDVNNFGVVFDVSLELEV